ncbi:MAG: hypothetical protein IKD29_02365, partial [Lentisphaeria bacterium]|nr:hypothetical protein [Lentisphaeria bacterium]
FAHLGGKRTQCRSAHADDSAFVHGWNKRAIEALVFIISKLKELKADGVDIRGNLTFVNNEYVEKVKSAGYEFAVWTIDDEPTARKLIELGVDAITSNCAGYLRGVVEK